MAGGKLSPRQKMINMMYLVLTAMLALNISKDILDALTKLNDSLEQTASTVDNKNEEIYAAFRQAASENPKKAGPWKDKAMEVKSKADELASFIDELKEELIKVSGGYDDETGEPKKLDAREDPANYLLNQGNATKLKNKIEDFRSTLASERYTAGNEQLEQTIKNAFDTDAKKVGDKKVEWESATFEHYPLVAILTMLTDYKAKVRNVESDVISELRRNITAEDVTFTNVRPVVVPKSNYITQGEEYQAEVFLAAYDATQEPEIYINGDKLSKEKIRNGKGFVSFKANEVGEVTWGGKIVITQVGQGEKPYTIPEQKFTVAPSSVVISPTKMNVLYRSVDNPLEIGVPGVNPEKVKASGPGLKQTGPGKYVADVTNIKGTEVTINVQVEETIENEDGTTTTETRPAGQKKFRIKGLPPAVGMVYEKSSGRLSKNALKRAEVQAEFKDFVFDLKLRVQSFEVAVPGFPPERVSGNRMNATTKQRIDQLGPGETVSIRNIKARTVGKNMRVNEVGNISIDVN